MTDNIYFDEPTPKKRKASRPYALAYWFVADYLGRDWNATDDKGWHLKHAKEVLSVYDEQDIRGTLNAIKSHIIDTGKIQVKFLTQIRYGEPSFVEQYKMWCKTPPPFYNKALVEQWETITGKVAYPDVGKQAVEVPILPSVASVAATF